jgi:hypothetical protein
MQLFRQFLCAVKQVPATLENTWGYMNSVIDRTNQDLAGRRSKQMHCWYQRLAHLRKVSLGNQILLAAAAAPSEFIARNLQVNPPHRHFVGNTLYAESPRRPWGCGRKRTQAARTAPDTRRRSGRRQKKTTPKRE